MYLSVVYMEPEGSPHDMETLNAGSTGIDYKHVALGILHHFQDMGMSAYEYIGTVSVHQFTGSGIITSGVSAYMGHKHLHPFTFKETVQRMDKPQVVIVAVACNSYKRLETAYFFRQLHSPAEVTCMPYLVHGLEEVLELPAEDAVCI